MKQATLCFLMKDGELLLALKKQGFAKGKWNGVGGKVEEGEGVEQCVCRETSEEIGVVLRSPEKVARLRFFFPEGTEYENWNQEVHVFVAREWEGEPAESDEVSPRWYNIAEIPYPAMWADDAHWLPRVLGGEKVLGDFYYADADTIARHTISATTDEVF